MRVWYALFATATILLACTEVVSSAGQNKLEEVDEVSSIRTTETTSTSKRLLRSYDTEKDKERVGINLSRVKRLQAPAVIKPNNIEKVLNIDMKTLNKLQDPKRADKLLARKKLGGWLGKRELNKMLNGRPYEKKQVMEKWRWEGRSPEQVTNLIKTADPSIQKKYKFVYELYAGYLSSARKKMITSNKRKRGGR